jgi:TRAP-type C4-dicarboxylate transport system substrate-binding protein
VKRGSRVAFALLGTAALAAGLAACGSSSKSSSSTSSSGGGTVTLRVGYVTTPQHPYGLALAKFKAAVEAASAGKITINTLPGASGGNDSTLLDDVKGGSIEMAAVSTAVWDSAGVQVFEPLQAPFLITNYPLDETVLSGPIGQGMLTDPNGPPKLGLVGLGLLEGGLRKPVGRDTALVSPATFNAKKLRAPTSEIMTSSLKDLGAEPVAMPLPDVAPALKNGTIDGLEANYGLIVTQKFYENAKYVTANVNLWPFPAAIVVNKAAWDKLSSDQQKTLQTAAANLAKDEINTIFISPPKTATNFVKVLCDAGMTFATATPDNLKALQTSVQPAIAALAANSVTSGYLKQIQDAKAAQAPLPPPPPLPAGCKTAS